MGGLIYNHIDWSKHVEDGVPIREVERRTGINFGTCRQYMVRHGWKPNPDAKTSWQNQHWNKPRKTSSLKYLRGGTLERSKKNSALPKYFKLALERLE